MFKKFSAVRPVLLSVTMCSSSCKLFSTQHLGLRCSICRQTYLTLLVYSNYAQEHNFAIPAINVTSSSTVVAALEAARDSKAPIILQMSQGGAAYFAGKGVDNKNQEASIAGGIAGAEYIRAIAPAYGIPVVSGNALLENVLNNEGF